MTSLTILIPSILFYFSDDSYLFFSHTYQNYLVETINSEIHKLPEWFKCNKFSLSAKKSSFMVFLPRQTEKGET